MMEETPFVEEQIDFTEIKTEEDLRAALVVLEAEANVLVKIDTHEQAQLATAFIAEQLQPAINFGEHLFEEPKAKAYAAHRSVCEAEAKLLELPRRLKKALGDAVAAWNYEEGIQAALREKELLKKAQEVQETLRQAEVEELRQSGHQAAAEALAKEPVATVMSTAVVAATPKLKGGSAKNVYGAEVVNLKELAKAVGEGKVPVAAIIPNTSWLEATAKAEGESFSIPGCKAVIRPTFRVTGKKRR